MPGLSQSTRLATPSGHSDGATGSVGVLGWRWRAGSLRDVSETYTAIYERDGEAWVVEIAEEPRVRRRCPSLAEARNSIRETLARSLKTDPEALRVVDDFRLPAHIHATRQSVKATRTEHERNQMMASMTDSRSATRWAKDLGVCMRDPVTVQALKNLGDREVSIDTFCHTITMAEELSRLTATGD
jgi:predicted RNase H-like HicB family nuclease